VTGSSFEAALDALVEPVMLTDAQGVITYTNTAGARRFGWDKEIGVPLGDRVARAPFV
jgi:PAS domain-containing protein